MKKLIQICSILSLLFVFTAVAAQAQSSTRYEAEIPFEFNVGEKSFDAGTYVIKVTKLATNGATLSLEDQEGNKLQTLLVSESGGVSNEKPELVFNSYENQRFLTKILTRESGIAIAMSAKEKQAAKLNREKKGRTQVAVAN